jgi:hypothetical protein
MEQQQQQQQQLMYGPAGDGVSELGPVALTLDNNRLTYHNGHWSAGVDSLISPSIAVDVIHVYV